MSLSITDTASFRERILRLYTFWNDENSSELKNADSLLVINGKPESSYLKTISLHVWLFGVELQDTILLLTDSSLYIFANKKKIDFLKPIQNLSFDSLQLKLMTKGEDDDKNFTEMLEAMRSSKNGKKVGHFTKDKNTSDFAKTACSKLSAGFDMVDVANSFSILFFRKDVKELALIKQACGITCQVYNQYVKAQIVEIIESDRKYKHSRIADGVTDALKNKKIIGNLDSKLLEACYDPIIQSGDKITLKFNNTSNNDSLHFGTIITALGIRYSYYCGNIIRTMMVNPTEQQDTAYQYLHDLMDWSVSRMKPSMKLSEFYQMIMRKVEQEKPEWVDKLVKNFGFGTGIEFRDANLLIAPKSTEVSFTKNCVVNFNLGLQGISNPAAKEKADKLFSCWLGETILVGEESAQCITQDAKVRLKSNRLVITEEKSSDESEEEQVNSKSKEEILGRGHRRAILENKTRNDHTAEDKRADRRRELFLSMQEQVKQRLSGFKPDAEVAQKTRSNVAYKGASQMPSEEDIRKLMVYVDKKYEAVIIPVFGLPTPFHISTIKNVSVSIEGQFNYLRINFHYPKATPGVQTPNSSATHIKELTLRARNQRKHGEVAPPSNNLTNANRLINECLKKFKSREAEERERANLVEQDNLIVSQSKGAFRLKDLYVRPNISTRRITGTLEAHTNGFRFVSASGDQVDILYNNIKHAFYQPCDGEMIILLHFHLKNAILYAKKKQIDIQFYAEVGELTTDLGKSHSRMQDRDDLEAEQHEREMREEIKRAFKTFCEKAENLARKYQLEFESPFRELGFFGCPIRSTVRLMPTSSCLVSLTEFPPIVLTLADVEFVMFERMSFSIKTFDMVFVFKDYAKKVQIVGSIPSNAQDLIKEWLLSCEIYYGEGTKSLNWTKLMKTITGDPESFLENGGWDFVSPDDDDSEGEQGENSEDQDDNYNPSASGSDGGESGSGDDSDYSGEDSEEEESDWDAEESSNDGSLDSDESEGLTWDELERRAAKEDNKRDVIDDERGGPKPTQKRHRSPSPKKSSNSKKSRR